MEPLLRELNEVRQLQLLYCELRERKAQLAWVESEIARIERGDLALIGVPPDRKAEMIKCVRELLDVPLHEARQRVEALPLPLPGVSPAHPIVARMLDGGATFELKQ